MRKPGRLIFFIGLFTLLILGSAFQFFWYIAKTPPGSVFPFVHNSVGDYYYYLSFIRQGMEGNFFAVSRYTSEIFPGKPLFLFFTTIGFLGGLLGLSGPMIYTLSRFLSAFLFLGIVFFLTTRLFPVKHRFIAFLFVFLVTPVWYRTPQLLRQIGDFWSGIDPLMRITFLPHHLFGNALFILSLFFFEHAVLKKSLLFGILCGLTGILSWTANIALFPVFVFIVVLFFLFHFKLLFDPAIRRIAVIIAVSTACELVIWAFSFSSSFPWGHVAQWEKTQQYALNPVQLFLMLGPLSLLAVGGVVVSRTRSYLWQVVSLWFIAPFVFLSVQRFLPVSNIRLIQSAPYIPTALLSAAAGLHILKHRLFRNNTWVGGIALACIIIYAIPSYIASVQNQMWCFQRNIQDKLFYIPQDGADIVGHLTRIGLPDDVVLAPDPLPVLIPSFSDKRVVYGIPLYTVNFSEKQKLGYEFFGGKGREEAKAFLDRERVRYIIFERTQVPSPEEMETIACTSIYENRTYLLCERETRTFSL